MLAYLGLFPFLQHPFMQQVLRGACFADGQQVSLFNNLELRVAFVAPAILRITQGPSHLVRATSWTFTLNRHQNILLGRSFVVPAKSFVMFNNLKLCTTLVACAILRITQDPADIVRSTSRAFTLEH